MGGELTCYPLGRTGYNGRVERSQRGDDEELYRPYLLKIRDEQEVLLYGHRWVYFCNALRPRFGHGMQQKPPLAVLRQPG